MAIINIGEKDSIPWGLSNNSEASGKRPHCLDRASGGIIVFMQKFIIWNVIEITNLWIVFKVEENFTFVLSVI